MSAEQTNTAANLAEVFHGNRGVCSIAGDSHGERREHRVLDKPYKGSNTIRRAMHICNALCPHLLCLLHCIPPESS